MRVRNGRKKCHKRADISASTSIAADTSANTGTDSNATGQKAATSESVPGNG